MKGQHRLDLIVAYLKNHTLVTVEQLVEAVDASPATIRRDLIKLDEQGVISRSHGGVALRRFEPAQPTTNENNCDRPLKTGDRTRCRIAGECWRCRRAGCRYDNDGTGEMLNPSSAAGHHRRSAYCAVFI